MPPPRTPGDFDPMAVGSARWHAIVNRRGVTASEGRFSGGGMLSILKTLKEALAGSISAIVLILILSDLIGKLIVFVRARLRADKLRAAAAPVEV